MGDSGMVMGDLVLTMDEVSPVMKKLIEGGIEVTALHNHLLRNQPFTMYMHVTRPRRPGEASGSTAHRAGGKQNTVRRSPPAACSTATDRSRHRRDRAALGAKGTNNGGVYQFGIPRGEPIKDEG